MIYSLIYFLLAICATLFTAYARRLWRTIGEQNPAENDFSVSFGKAGKLMIKYLTMDVYSRVFQTYSGADIKNYWKSLFIMTELFGLISIQLSLKFDYLQTKEEQENTVDYLIHLHNNQKNHS